MLTRLGALARQWAGTSPWTNVYGLARTLLALGTLGTLLFTSSSSLFRPAVGIPDFPHCDGATSLGLFCVVPVGQLELARWIAVVLLLAAASGWRPQLTAVPHWWVAFSLQGSATIPDGGDQISAILALLILPIALTDRRRWHWSRPAPADEKASLLRFPVVVLIAWSASVVIRVQVAAVYFQSSIAKLGVEEWVNGTALYYWLTDPMFGAPSWAAAPVRALIEQPLGVVALTWGPLVLEFALVLGLIARRWVRPYLLLAGIALHVSIASLMGLWSFAFAMFAALLLFLRPLENPVPTARVSRWARRLVRATRLTRWTRGERSPGGPDQAARKPVAGADHAVAPDGEQHTSSSRVPVK